MSLLGSPGVQAYTIEQELRHRPDQRVVRYYELDMAFDIAEVLSQRGCDTIIESHTDGPVRWYGCPTLFRLVVQPRTSEVVSV